MLHSIIYLELQSFIMVFKLLSIVFLSCVPFLLSLNGDFVFDDTEAIVKNKDVTSNSWENLFSNDFWGTSVKSNLSHKSYRPFTIISFRINYLLSGNKLSAFAFKVTNLICHAICCILVWWTFESILYNPKVNIQKKWWQDASFLATLVFAVHPIHVEAVCGIVGRADILAAIAFFLAFLCYNKAVKSKKHQYTILCVMVILSITSMLFKENGVTVLGFCVLYEIIIKLRLSKSGRYLDKPSIVRIIYILVATTVLLYGRWMVMGGTTPVFKPTDNPAAFANQVLTKIGSYNYIYSLNFLLFLWPQWLCYDWSMGCIPLLENINDYRIILVLLMYLYGVLILRSLLNRNNKVTTKRYTILAIFIIIVPFLPAANIFYPVGFVIAERILYIPSAGYCLLLAMGVNKIINRNCKLGIAMYTFILLSYGLRSWQRSLDWQNEYDLFISGLAVCPLNAKVHYNIAKVADARQHTDWALTEYEESIRLYPEYYQAMNNLANLLKNQKKFTEAEYHLRTAISYKYDFPAAWMNLGIVLASTGRHEESQNAYKTALKYRKNYTDCYYNLGNLYLEMNKTEDAMNSWLQAINLNSKHVLAWTNLMALLDNTGKIDIALQVIPEALKELPDSPSVNFAIANIYGKMDRYKDAEEYFIQAIKLFGKQVQAIHYANLGVLYHRWKKYHLAEQMYLNALKIDPYFKSAHKNLGSLLKINM